MQVPDECLGSARQGRAADLRVIFTKPKTAKQSGCEADLLLGRYRRCLVTHLTPDGRVVLSLDSVTLVTLDDCDGVAAVADIVVNSVSSSV